MILIADSGSTKTDWALCENGSVKERLKTEGINPFITPEEHIAKIISQQVYNQLSYKSPERIYFYGSGCSTTEKKKLVRKHLLNNFSSARVEVDHDLLAAARSVCGNEKGIVGILGTGSNACIFDGKNVTSQITSLGYILGDEGSGAYIGKVLLNNFFYNALPEDLHKKFESTYALKLEEVLDTVYKKNAANAYLASFTKFLKDEINHPYASSLIVKCFDLYFKKLVNTLHTDKDMLVYAVGSVAYYFKDQLILAAQANNRQIGNVLLNPMEGLINYHK